VTFSLLVAVKTFAHLCYRREVSWVGAPPPHPWKPIDRIRVVAFLNHTSLFEPLFSIMPPLSFFWRVARHGVVPAAEKTLKRPLVGRLFGLIAGHVVSVTRERDHTWRAVLEKIGPESMVVILPEGRMMRANGLDAHGEPMTVRGGISDILEVVQEGAMLIAYSGGLHHVQIPGQHLPRLFRTIRMRFELVDIAAYRTEQESEAAAGGQSFKRRVVEDLEARRDRYCPIVGGSTARRVPVVRPAGP